MLSMKVSLKHIHSALTQKFNRNRASPSTESHVNFTLLCLLVTFRVLDVFFIIQSVLWYKVNHTNPFLSGEVTFSNFENTSCKILYFYYWKLNLLL